MERIKKLCSYLDPCESFADVGCDHGYCTEYMLQNGLCKKAIVSDVSEKCLLKAKNLLNDYVRCGICTAECCDGLEKIPSETDLVLIAGMGGEEIIRILKNSFVPRRFVFQPMKNAERLRSFLLEAGCELTLDDLFFADGKYYFIVKGRRTGLPRPYTEEEIRFGKDSLKNKLLCEMLEAELQKKRKYLSAEMSEESRRQLSAEINYTKGIIKHATQQHISNS